MNTTAIADDLGHHLPVYRPEAKTTIEWVRRSVSVFGMYRRHREDPEAFYRTLADAAATTIDEGFGLAGRHVLDLGCGPGWYLDAMRRKGADVVGIDGDYSELIDRTDSSTGVAVGDGTCLPFPDACFDGVVCSNMLEHTPAPDAVLIEVARIVRPGGWAYVSWTPWYSPWGGHDMNPYQYLGPKHGPRLYEYLHGPPRKNRFGEGLWPTHIATVLRGLRNNTEFILERAEPRYWPQFSPIVWIPGVREVLTGNCALHLRRR